MVHVRSEIDSQAIRRLAREVDTPFYVYDQSTIHNRHEELASALAGARLFYSLKANPNKKVAAILRRLGCGVEVASAGELTRAVDSGFEPAEILFIGPGKTKREIVFAAELGVKHFVVDNLTEVEILRKFTDIRSIIIRVNPSFKARGGKLTMSGGRPKQFGIDRPEVGNFINLSRALEVDVRGLHYYLGTRFLNSEDIVSNTRQILADAIEIEHENSLDLSFLDMGGGFGIPYFDGESRLDLQTLRAGLADILKTATKRLPKAQIAFESGRYLTADAGTLVLEVVNTRKSYGTLYCVCNGGTNLNMAVIGTGSIGKRNFPACLLPEHSAERPQIPTHVTVTGPLCTPDDTLLKNVEWQFEPQAGDLVVISRVGAYGPSASPHSFLGHEFPNELVIDSNTYAALNCEAPRKEK